MVKLPWSPVETAPGSLWWLDMEFTQGSEVADPAISLDRTLGSRPDHTLAVDIGEPMLRQGLPRLLVTISGLSGCLQRLQIVWLELVIRNECVPPHLGGRLQVLWW